MLVLVTVPTQGIPLPIRDSEEDLEEHEYPDEDDLDDDETAPCPFCGAFIYEEAERCPECGMYLSKEDLPPSRKPTWFLVGLVLCMIVVLGWYLRR